MSFRSFSSEKVVRFSLRSLGRRRQRYPSACYSLARLQTVRTSLLSSVAQEHHQSVVRNELRSFSTFEKDRFEHYRHLTQDVVELIQRENKRTRECIDQTLKEEIAQEILEAYNSATETVPELGPTGQHLYFAEDYANGKRRYRRRHVESGKEQPVLDISFHEYQVLSMSLSVNETFVAYLVSPVASPSQTLVKIRHLDAGHEFDLPMSELTVANVEWGPLQPDGSNSLFIITSNKKGRSSAVYACCVDSTETESTPLQCIYQNDDEGVMVDVQRTKGCKHVAIYASTKTSSEIYLIDNVQGSLLLVRPRQEGVLYHVDVGEDDDVFLLAHAAEPEHESGLSEEMTLFETTVSSLPLQTEFGKQYSGTDDKYIIADMDVFKDFVALYERSSTDGRHRIRLIIRGEYKQDIILPLPQGSGDCAVLSSGGNMYYNSTNLRFRVESPCSPGRTFSYDMSSGDIQALTDELVPTRYNEKRVFVTSEDGTLVPMSVISMDSDVDKPQSNPTVLIGYGCYGEPVFHGFDPTIVPLLDRGFIVAYAHTRGGGELGRAWYRSGRLYDKEKAVQDYIACAEALVDSLGISEPQMLTGKAFSAGGVIVASAVNQRPSMFGSVVLTNAFLDVTKAMTTNTDKLTEHEYSEWGNLLCDDKAATSVSSYCPMANVSLQEYPPMLLVGTMDDTNVPFWHPLTFCLKVRKALKASEINEAREEGKECRNEIGRRVLLHIEAYGGHQLHGTKLDVAAMEIAFIIRRRQGVGD